MESIFQLSSVVVFFTDVVPNNNNQPAKEPTAQLSKRGPVICLGPPGQEFGSVQFTSSCSAATKDFNLGIALLHSFEYDEAEKLFAKVIDADPACAMGYWEWQMCNFYQVWPSPH
ncbi:MAG: tetratricopeptide repeat protein [Chitinophagaceae bacterium]|nr:tetratricopeptide repeat protein [Chitinophagaceae bacterium]